MNDEAYKVGLIQERLKELGFDPGAIDNQWGPKSQAALTAYVKSLNPINPVQIPEIPTLGFDARSESNIRTLHPFVQTKARDFLRKALDAGFNVKIISGTRTPEEQDALYASGRTKAGPIVTKARAWQSNHNFGIAFDVGLFDGSKYLEDSPLYAKLSTIGKDVGFEWGGDWTGGGDEPHYQWPTLLSFSELRQRIESGKNILPI